MKAHGGSSPSPSASFRRGDREAEGARLLSVCGVKLTEGSNPSLSARSRKAPFAGRLSFFRAMNDRRLPALTGLRGLAALWVLVVHAWALSGAAGAAVLQ